MTVEKDIKISTNKLIKIIEGFLLRDERNLSQNEIEGLIIIIENLVKKFPTFDLYTAEIAGKQPVVVCGTHKSSISPFSKKNKPAFGFYGKKVERNIKIIFKGRSNDEALFKELDEQVNFDEFRGCNFELSDLVYDKKVKSKLKKYIDFHSDSPSIKSKMKGDGKDLELAKLASKHKAVSNSEAPGRTADINEVLNKLSEGSNNEITRDLREVKLRLLQPLFKEALIEIHGFKCAISGCNVKSVLDAAHIEPHNGKNDNIENGILLRTDIHRLYDRDILTINENGIVSIGHETADYSYLDGTDIFESLILSDKQKKALRKNLKIKFDMANSK